MKLLALLLLTTTLLTGCGTLRGHLYPIQGPLSGQTPTPIFPISMGRIVDSGPLSATLQSGELLKGTWNEIPPNDPTANQRAAEWDTVYGQGYFVANILGNRIFGRAALTGPQGTTLNVEFYEPSTSDMTAARGIAEDSKGNLYKVAFGL